MAPKRSKKKKTTMIECTIMGCGTSVGAPMIGMQKMKQFRNPKNWRLRCSLLIEPFGRGGPAIVIDTSPDFREQALRYFPKLPRLDGVLLTHTHADHLHGLDDIRPFNFFQQATIPLYSSPDYLGEIEVKFAYIFQPTQEGGGKPRLQLVPFEEASFRLTACRDPLLQELEVTPLRLEHGSIHCWGFRIGKMAYLTDCSEIPESTLAKMQGLEFLVLDCLRPKPHTTHMHVERTLQYAERIQAKKTILTHMGYELEYESFRKSLPRNIVPAYDGLRFKTIF